MIETFQNKNEYCFFTQIKILALLQEIPISEESGDGVSVGDLHLLPQPTMTYRFKTTFISSSSAMSSGSWSQT